MPIVREQLKRFCRNCKAEFFVNYPSSGRTNCSSQCRGVKQKVRSDAGTRKSEWMTFQCPCGEFIERPAWKAKEQQFQYCNSECTEKFRPLPKGRPASVSKKSVMIDGYVWIYLPPEQRPQGWHRSRYPEHRQVMREILGRDLLPGENVHHINGVRSDNRAENLELWLTSQPKGQRVEDVITWAKEILSTYS